MVTSVAFGLGGDVITGDSSGRIYVWSKNSSEAFIVDKQASENLRHAHEVSVELTWRSATISAPLTADTHTICNV